MNLEAINAVASQLHVLPFRRLFQSLPRSRATERRNLQPLRQSLPDVRRTPALSFLVLQPDESAGTAALLLVHLVGMWSWRQGGESRCRSRMCWERRLLGWGFIAVPQAVVTTCVKVVGPPPPGSIEQC